MQAFDPTGRYGGQAVLDVLQGKYGGRTVDFRYELYDALNRKKADLVGVLSGQVSHDASADIKRTAQFELRDGYDQIDYLSDRIKPWYRLQMPDGGWVEWPQGVFLLSSPTRTLNTAGSVVRSVSAYDQGVVLSADAVTDRYSIAAGTLFVDAIRGVVADRIPAIAIVSSSLTLPVTWDYEAGTTILTIVNDLLSAIGYRSAWFNEDGILICEPYVLPDQRGATYTYATDNSSVVVGDINQSLDLFDIPNRWVLTVSDTDRGSFTSSFTNVSPTSPTSTVRRGRTIVVVDSSVSAADQSALDVLTQKRAYEESQVFEQVEYTSLVMPFHQNADILTITMPGLDLGGVKVEELSWSCPLQVGATMSHVVRRVVSVA